MQILFYFFGTTPVSNFGYRGVFLFCGIWEFESVVVVVERVVFVMGLWVVNCGNCGVSSRDGLTRGDLSPGEEIK